MKVVITGGMGFIGRNLAAYLRRHAKKCELHCIDWYPETTDRDLALYDSSITACFASEAAKQVYANADAVVHLAATTTVQESITNPAASFDNNVVKTQVLLDHLLTVAPATHFVFASTGGAIIGDHDGAIDETIPARPKSPYGATKLAVEGMLSAYAGSYGFSSAALRFSNVYGPGSERKSSVIAKFCQSYINGDQMVINGDGEQSRDYIYVDDICKAVFSAIQKRSTGVYQLGTGIGTTINELVDILTSVGQKGKLERRYGPDLQGEVRHNICEITYAQKQLGFDPEIALKVGLEQTLDWFSNSEKSLLSRQNGSAKQLEFCAS